MLRFGLVNSCSSRLVLRVSFANRLLRGTIERTAVLLARSVIVLGTAHWRAERVSGCRLAAKHMVGCFQEPEGLDGCADLVAEAIWTRPSGR